MADLSGDKQTRFIVNTAFFFCFFPSLLYFVIPTQTQPVAAAIAFPLLLARPLRLDKLLFPFVALTCVISLYAVGTMLVYPEIVGSVIVNAGSYISPLILFVAMYDKLHLVSARPLNWAIGIWSAVGAVQALPFPAFVKAPVQGLGKLLLERFVAGPYSDGGRGYSLIGSEPSISAPTIFLMAMTVHFLHRAGKLSWKGMIASYAGVGWLVFLNRSGSIGLLFVLLLVGVAIGGILKSSATQRLWSAAGGLGAVGLLFGAAFALPDANIRLLIVLRGLIDLATSHGSDLLKTLIVLGGQRIIPIALGYGSLMHNWGLGHGIASWTIESVVDNVRAYVGISQYDFLDLLKTEIGGPVGITQDKPQSYAALIAFDTGVPGMISFGWVLLSVLRYRHKLIGDYADNRLIYILPAIVWLLLFPLSTLPAPWMLFAYSIYVSNHAPNPKTIRFRISWGRTRTA